MRFLPIIHISSTSSFNQTLWRLVLETQQLALLERTQLGIVQGGVSSTHLYTFGLFGPFLDLHVNRDVCVLKFTGYHQSASGSLPSSSVSMVKCSGDCKAPSHS